jgi:AcrR family transcriptional regulator
MDEKAATRDRILAAAMERIKHYGYGKTTMAEIAADCDMSPGNIYRFFEAKIDIAEAMARKHYAEEHANIAAIARRKEWPADRKLREVLSRKMRENFRMFEDNAKILEVAEVLSRERPLFLNELMAQERVLLKAIIEEGVASGLFAETDAEFTAEMIQSATVKFSLPQLFSKLTLPKLEREFEGVLGLLLRGLSAPGARPAEAADAKAQRAAKAPA